MKCPWLKKVIIILENNLTVAKKKVGHIECSSFSCLQQSLRPLVSITTRETHINNADSSTREKRVFFWTYFVSEIK